MWKNVTLKVGETLEVIAKRHNILTPKGPAKHLTRTPAIGTPLICTPILKVCIFVYKSSPCSSTGTTKAPAKNNAGSSML